MPAPPAAPPPDTDMGKPRSSTPGRVGEQPYLDASGRPWRLGADRADVIAADGFAVLCDYEYQIARNVADANARLIVTAVNNHDRLLAALRPFVEFHADGAAWGHTAWAHKPDSEAVLYDHRSGRSISLGDFKRAAAALAAAASPATVAGDEPQASKTDSTTTNTTTGDPA